jgi:hypothetical protein
MPTAYLKTKRFEIQVVGTAMNEVTTIYTDSVLKNKEIREKAKLLYLGGYSPEEIATMINSHPDDIGRLVYGEDGTGESKRCWSQIKARMQPTAITAFLAEKAHVFERTTGLALKILTSNLEKLCEYHDDPTTPPMKPDELAMISSIVMNMDKICRLETGKATQIVQQIGITPEEARKILQEDPMNNVVEAEYHEIMKSLEDA